MTKFEIYKQMQQEVSLSYKFNWIRHFKNFAE